MGSLNDMEMNLYESNEGGYHLYDSQRQASLDDGDGEAFNQVRYAMAISHNASSQDQDRAVMYIGGLGVLGNLVSQLGTSVIPRWRGTRDIDLVLQRRDHSYLVDSSFDIQDVASHQSLSIKNKLTSRGASRDSENQRLPATSVDIYYPNQPFGEVPIQDISYDRGWDHAVTADFFGVPLICAPPQLLLRSKLEVDCETHHMPRKQDAEDVLNLVALAEMTNVTPGDLVGSLSGKHQTMLRKVVGLAPNGRDVSPQAGNPVIMPSQKYIWRILQ